MVDGMAATEYELGLHVCFPGDVRRAPLPDAEGDDPGESGWDTSRTVHLDLSIDQLGWIPTSL